MLDTPDRLLDIPAFFRWVAERENRYELVKGRPVMLPHVTRNHMNITKALFRVLDSRVDQTKFAVNLVDFGIQTGQGLRYPDVMVEILNAPQGSDRYATTPVFIAEILFQSTAYADFNEKGPEYMALPTLQDYMVLAQDEVHIWHWQRGAEGWPQSPMVTHDREAEIAVPALGLTLPVSGLYKTIPDPI